MSSKVQSTGPRAKDHGPSAQESLPPPVANAEAIHFLSSLEQNELQTLFFSETLTVVTDTGEPQGELTIEVQRGKYKDECGVMSHCLLVHAFSRSFVDKMLCGNSLLGYLSSNLEIKEQQSQEFIKFHILPMERKISLLKQDDQLAVTRSVKEGEEVKTEVTIFPWHSVTGFISEAANLVLLRVMGWRQMVPSNARFLALDTEGKLCYSTYEGLGFQTIQVDRQQVKVFIVEQTVHSTAGIPMSCQFFLLSDGHLAKRVQVGSRGYCMVTKMPITREMRESLARYLRRSPWCGRRTWNSTPSSWTERRSSVSATRTTCGTTPRPKRSSPTSCSSCCCASRPTCSPSPPSTSVPSRGAARRPPPRSPPAGPAPSARRSRGPAPARARRPPGAPGRGRGRGKAGLERGRDAPWRRAVRAAVLMEINGALPTASAVGTGTFLGQTRVLAKDRNR
ncbi:ciliogenesis-associated TTC17-interacting protein isoform X1 [Manis javanica]|uniref:ciliogenesis-associated TTC17-interacting protein isoform X1 n=2 Tax=Manis javanica TaxID=9974 RepID=UPI003C6D4F26